MADAKKIIRSALLYAKLCCAVSAMKGNPVRVGSGPAAVLLTLASGKYFLRNATGKLGRPQKTRKAGRPA